MDNVEKRFGSAPSPDISSMHGRELKQYFRSLGFSPPEAESLVSQEISRRIETLNETYAAQAGISKEDYLKLWEQYGNEHTTEILRVLKEGKAATPQGAHTLLMKQAEDTSNAVIDSLNKAVNMPQEYRHSYPGGRILEADIRHEVYKSKRHIGKKAVAAMTDRYFKKHASGNRQG